ncbi:hypothetical protein L7F22_065050 [Adiantum nelumboides]|nr:hypothetical protein [Adiantum nelumboides]
MLWADEPRPRPPGACGIVGQGSSERPSARQRRAEAGKQVVSEAIFQAGVKESSLSAIAVTIGPGLSLCLRVGVRKARSLAKLYQLPWIGVHHMEAHAMVARLTDRQLEFPFLVLLVSVAQGSANRNKIRTSPSSDPCYATDLRQAALLRSLQMRAQSPVAISDAAAIDEAVDECLDTCEHHLAEAEDQCSPCSPNFDELADEQTACNHDILGALVHGIYLGQAGRGSGLGRSLLMEGCLKLMSEICSNKMQAAAEAYTQRKFMKAESMELNGPLKGGHNLLLLAQKVGEYIQLGTSLDDAIGEAYDKTARELGLDLARGGGPAVEELALEGNPKAVNFSVPMRSHQDCNFSFAGLKTQVKMEIASKAIKPNLVPIKDADAGDRQVRADIAASFQRVAVLHLEDRCARAIDWAKSMSPIKSLVISGGVASNKVVRQRLGELAEKHGFRLSCPPPRLCTDNGVMIAWTGVEHYKLGRTQPPPPHDEPEDVHLDLRPRWQLGEIYTEGQRHTRPAKTAKSHPSLTAEMRMHFSS